MYTEQTQVLILTERCDEGAKAPVLSSNRRRPIRCSQVGKSQPHWHLEGSTAELNLLKSRDSPELEHSPELPRSSSVHTSRAHVRSPNSAQMMAFVFRISGSAGATRRAIT